MHTLLLFTDSFPSKNSNENAFLKNELQLILLKFDRIIVIPEFEQEPFQISSDFDVNFELAKKLYKETKLTLLFKSLTKGLFYKELLSKKIYFWNLFRLKRLINDTGRFVVVEKWFKEYYTHYFNNSLPLTIYTYWNSYMTLALSNLFKNNYIVKVITRAHGHDLYEERYGGYIPFYFSIVERVDRIYTVSKAGYNYLSNKYPEYKHKINVSYLGVDKAKVLSDYSSDNILRIVSCSNLIKIKRVELIIQGIIQYISNYKQKVYWVHFGNGQLFNDIIEYAKQHKNNEFDFCFKGYVQNNEILEYYQTNPVDIFITASQTEGLPVSLQEAQAYGIPVIGTDVGGISELINDKVGVLLPSNPSPINVAEAIHSIIFNKSRFLSMRNESVKNWATNFDSRKNFSSFVTSLFNLFKEN